MLPGVGFLKNEAYISDFVSPQTKHSKKRNHFVSRFVCFRLRFMGYPKQVKNEEKVSCTFLLFLQGSPKKVVWIHKNVVWIHKNCPACTVTIASKLTLRKCSIHDTKLWYCPCHMKFSKNDSTAAAVTNCMEGWNEVSFLRNTISSFGDHFVWSLRFVSCD